MLIHFDGDRPLYVQLAEGIEDAILSGAFPEESQVPSTTEISVGYKINPATALKGIGILVDEGILYKKRGLGMFVSSGACETIARRRKEGFLRSFVAGIVGEAHKLDITKSELITMIESEFDK